MAQDNHQSNSYRQVVIRLGNNPSFLETPSGKYKIPKCIEVMGLDDVTVQELGDIIFQLSSHRMHMIAANEQMQRDFSVEGGQNE